VKQKDLLVQIMQLVINSGVCPETDEKEWAKLILFAHTRGFLYVSPDAQTAVCAYRSESPELADSMPMEESGPHLHIAWAASASQDKTVLLRMLRSYLKQNKVEDICYNRRNSETDFKKLKVRNV